MSVLPVGFSGSGDYTIERSLRFRSSASASLQRTFTTPTNGTKWTYSLWMKKSGIAGTGFNLPYLLCTVGTGAQGFIGFGGNQADDLYFGYGGNARRISPALLRDPAAWYHLVFSIDTTQATESNRAKVYVNGVQFTWTTSTAIGLNDTTQINQAVAHNIGRQPSQPYDSFNGYLTEVNFIDGEALDASSFGEFDAVTGVWQPIKYSGSYGTNGFYLPFSDNTNTTTLAADSSGNGNDWTPNNISLTSGVTYDSMTDTPTPYFGGGNYATLNPLRVNTTTLSNGNLKCVCNNAATKVLATFGMTSGKWYWEVVYSDITGAGNLGIATEASSTTSHVGNDAFSWGYESTGNKRTNSITTAYGSSYTTGDVIGVAFDADAGTLVFYKNNVSQGTAYSGLTSGPYFCAVGDNSLASSSTLDVNFGQRPFAYTPPTGFLPLHTGNLPDSTILEGSQYFNTVTYSGTGASLSIPVGFIPDFTWIKRRNAANNNQAFDVLRNSNVLVTNETGAESDYSAYFDFSDSDGFDLPAASVNMNNASGTYVAWNWKANGAGVSNTAGTITSTVSANPTAGFSIVTYAGNGTGGATVGHGLGVAPSMLIVKSRSQGVGAYTGRWDVYHTSIGATGRVYLNQTDAVNTSSAPWNNTAPTSTVFTLGTSGEVNYSGDNFVAYCFAAVPGFSKFGSYTGNGSADGPFVYTGFRPRYLLLKRADVAADWFVGDTSRNTYNSVNNLIQPSSSNAESTYGAGAGEWFDLLSNGFKLRSAITSLNANSGTYIYMAFAENPFKNSLAR